MTGKQELVSVTIDPSAVDPDDVEMLQDLVIAAVNDALRASQELAEQKMARRHRRPQAPGHVAPSRVATPLIEPVARLIESFARLPGIGPKTAQRLTYHLLRAPDAEARTLAAALVAVRDQVVFCERCFNISDAPLCAICRDPGRDQTRLCVVEEPLDVLALERTAEFRGLYHVLHGAISPIDGIGPDRLQIRELLARADEASATARRSMRSSWPRTRRSKARPPPCTWPSGWSRVVGVGHPGSPAGSRSAATSSTPTRSR